ncbi:hypothetical protein O0L34_g10117 [Tuta absoluta]|nr:hypothetical protein O0L34_g10117 [Tuta absoluta]
MGALVSRALRPIKSFNIENRAHRVISKEKPTVAPMYPSNIADMKRALERDPDLNEKIARKDDELDVRLRDVYVTSTGRPEDDITKEKQQNNPNRPLPENRTQTEEFEYGFKEPERIPYGRTTIRHALNFISAHQTNPKEVTSEKIALEYKLKQEDVVNILKYFKTYEVYVPETKKTPAVFAGPATLRKQMEKSSDFHFIDETGNAIKDVQSKPEVNKIETKTEAEKDEIPNK